MLTKWVLILMKMRKLIYVVLMMVLVGCTPPGPLKRGKRYACLRADVFTT